MNILVDTSVWVDHFRHGNPALVELINHDHALMHPMVLLETACGTPPTRRQTLRDMNLLRPSAQAAHGEVLDFVEREKLFGMGCGLVDMSLLASTLITPGALLWTLDKRLEALALRFKVAYTPIRH